MKIALLFLILIATFSCKEVETEIPICIQDILDNDTTNHAPIVKVLVQIE